MISCRTTIDWPPQIGVPINPVSHRNRKDLPRLSRIASELHAIERRAIIPEEVALALAHFARNNVNLIVISGGDGTVQAVLTALFGEQPFETLPLLAILRGGTTDMTADDIGVSGDQVKALRRLLKWSYAGPGRTLIEI